MASRQPSFLDTIRERRAGDTDTPRITLLDRTKSVEDIDGLDNEVEASRQDSIDKASLSLSQRLTSNSLNFHKSVRQQVARQKYRRYDRERYDLDDTPSGESPSRAPLDADTASQGVGSYLERGRAKAKGLIKRKKGLGRGKNGQDTAIDILWENQRGVFFFGVPRYSSNSLLPSDPKPWQNAQFRTSPVDIRNAQVPDPSWEWAWKSWYVDMSRDVDEEGWEYSFAFKINFDWHGNHPWFHSFVRRRRWLRMRRRKPDSQVNSKATSHDLASEYFTIHAQETQRAYEDRSRTRNIASKNMRHASADNIDDDDNNIEILTIGQLMRYLKGVALDREKLVAIRSFVNAGGDEVHYLSERMPDIINLLIYQASRRQVVADLKTLTTEADNRKRDITTHDRSDNEREQNALDADARRIESLERAIDAADTQVKELEYWSDVKSVMSSDDAIDKKSSSRVSGTAKAERPAFSSKQDAEEPGNTLHKHPEHSATSKEAACTGAAPETSPESKRSSDWFDTMPSGQSMESNYDEDATPLERYATPAESASAICSPTSFDVQPSRQSSTRISSFGDMPKSPPSS